MKLNSTYLISASDEKTQAVFDRQAAANWQNVLPPIEFNFASTPDDKDAELMPWSWQHGEGAWHCRDSHLRLMNHFIDETKYEHVCIIEDDIILIDGCAEKCNIILSQIPTDCEFLWLGGQWLTGIPAARDCRLPFCRVTKKMNRLHCYVVSRSAAELIIDMSRYDNVNHIDDMIGDMYTDINMYAAVPFLVGQSAGVSSISGRTVGERFWND